MRYAVLGLAFILALVWLCAFVIFHVVGAVVHLLLLVALVLFVVHLIRSPKRPARP